MARRSDPAFATVLNRLMAARGMSQADLARKIDASPTQISRYCRGLEVPGIRRLDHIATLFGVDRDLLELHIAHELLAARQGRLALSEAWLGEQGTEATPDS